MWQKSRKTLSTFIICAGNSSGASNHTLSHGCFKNKMHVHKLYIVLLSSLVLIGCKSDNYVGKIVPQQNRIALQRGGPHPGIWSGNHMTFRYGYFKTPSQIEFSGKLNLVHIPASVDIARIGFWVHFLDSEGRIIRDRTVFSSDAFWVGGKYIQKNLNPPTGTKGMTFSYQVSVGSGHGDDSENFHMAPHRMKRKGNATLESRSLLSVLQIAIRWTRYAAAPSGSRE